MKQILILLLIVLSFETAYSQKINTKSLVHNVVSFPENPIPASYKSYSMEVVDGGTEALKYAKEKINLSYINYSSTSNLALTLTVYDINYSGTHSPYLKQYEIKSSIKASLGYTLHDGVNNYMFGTINLIKEVSDGKGGYKEESKNYKEKKTIPKDELSEYFVLNPETKKYILTEEYKEKMLEEEMKLLIDEASTSILFFLDKTRNVKFVKYVGIKKHDEEKMFSDNLKQLGKDIKNDPSYDLSNFESISFWKDKAETSTDAMLQGVALFNLVSIYSSVGDMLIAKKYFELLKKLNVEIPAKAMEKLTTMYSENSDGYLKLYDETGTYTYNKPMEVKKEGYFIVIPEKGMQVVSEREYEEMIASLEKAKEDEKKVEEYNRLKIIDGDKGMVVTKENERLEGEIFINLDYRNTLANENTLGLDGGVSPSVSVRAVNEKGKTRNTSFKSKKVDYFTAGGRKFYSYDIKTFSADALKGSTRSTTNPAGPKKEFFEEIKVFSTGVLVRSYISIEMDYAIKLNHAEKVIVLKNSHIKMDPSSRIDKLFSECVGMSDALAENPSEYSKEFLVSLLEAHDLNCNK